MTGYTVDILIALEKGERLTKAWWARRYEWGARRAGGMPPEIPEPSKATLKRQTDPESGERFACITLPLPEGISLGRANELCHMLSSVLTSEGYTLRVDGKREESIPGESAEPLRGEFGGTAYTEARVCSHRCLSCVFADATQLACCGEGAAFSLADIGSVLLNGGEELVSHVLALPGELDGVKWHPYLAGGRCVYHSPDRGCTLPSKLMPLQCRTYLCMPDKLLPPDLLAEYEGYVDSLEEEELFVEEHMREESGVDFESPQDQIREAARKAFAAWRAGGSVKRG